MIITTLNTDKKFNKILSSFNDKGEEILFVDWIPTDDITKSVKTQVNTITSFLHKEKRVIIFDRFSILTKDEVDFFIKNNVILYEPVINCRRNFNFLPYWIDIQSDYSLEIFNKRKYSITFDNYEWEGIKLLGKSIYYNQNSKTSENKYKLFINDKSMPDIRSCIQYGTIPLLFHTNKWYHALFHNFIIKDLKEFDYYLRMYKHCAYGFIIEFNNNIKHYMPEMIIENWIENFINSLK